jgi:hypothetical protein
MSKPNLTTSQAELVSVYGLTLLVYEALSY